MPQSSISTDIQVAVRWKEQPVFAGHNVECTITFKNISAPSPPPTPPRSRSRTISSRTSPAHSHSHHSCNFPSTSSRSPTVAAANTNTNGNGSERKGHRHQKSLSIISFDSDRASTGAPLQSPAARTSHTRSISVQSQPPPRRVSTGEGLALGLGLGQGLYDFKFPTTLSPVEAPRDSPTDLPPQNSNSNATARRPFTPRSNDENPSYAPSLPSIASPTTSSNPNANPNLSSPRSRPPSLLDSNASTSRLAPLTPMLSETTGISTAGASSSTSHNNNNTITESARSSADLYSVSNLSSETLESEYTQYTTSRNLLQRNSAGNMHSRGPSISTLPSIDLPRRSATTTTTTRAPKTQTLLMGYAQISGTFSVDGSLVDQSQFEKVKRSGVMGTQGNGPATGAAARASQPADKRGGGGFWRNLGLNKIEESISGFLGSAELDGLREMRGVTSSSSIPLLSTPQSLLFVDLQLHPGEEKSFSFSFRLPRGLPASHKGKAIKISYNLIIGTQRPSQGKEMQKVNRISVPFRVLTGVDVDGEILGHDLTRPYVLLRDEALVQKLENKEQPLPPRPKPTQQITGDTTWTGTSDFLNYVDALIRDKAKEKRQEPPSLSQSPSTPSLAPASHTGLHPLHYTCKTAIDRAILSSNHPPSSEPGAPKSRNRFEITRSGRRIAVIVLNRPAHRLGETITATIDFTGAALPCYSLYATLESSEKVHPSIALRSSTSISRATRRVYGSCAENTLFAQRVAFTPSIPVSATPTLVTSGVELKWELRFEFVTSTSTSASGSGVHEHKHDEFDVGPTGARLLEAVEEDERHVVLASLEYLACESFEVAIPLVVYGVGATG
ncbi:hypothetical protein KEM56_007401 [Ascosphaera pollenicola]|nr:hypothetical protein KEM56_007401 [Ascosphaera pollenicola]